MARHPVIDDRRYQDLVEEAMRFIEQRSEGGAAPGGLPVAGQRMVIEAAAAMVDQLIYRVNQMPRRLYPSLLELLGVRRLPPQAARVQITFCRAGQAHGRLASRDAGGH